MSEENQNVVKKNVLKSYLAMARDCVGAKVWQHFYAEVDGEEIDVRVVCFGSFGNAKAHQI
jgi:hypothetical protein